MADGHGGYRRPTHPAAASGPGRLSRRTDGRQPRMDLPDAKYGEQQAFQAAQAAAPMAADAGGMAAQPMGVTAPDLSGLIPMDAPTQMPDQPITAGMPDGDGAGSPFPSQQQLMTPEQAARMRSYLPTLILLASRDDASPATRQFVRQMRADLG